MMQRMNDFTKGWVATVIIGLVSITFILWGIHYYLESGKSTSAIAKVNGVNITQAAFNAAYSRAQRNMSDQTVSTDDDALADQLKTQTLEQLLQTVVLTQAAKKNGFSVSPLQVEIAIQTMPIFHQDGKFSLPRYQQILRYLNYTQTQFEQSVKRQMLIEQVLHGIADSAFILPNDVNTAIKLINQRRDFSYILIKPQNFMTKVSLTQSEIETYYHEHAEQFTTPEQVQVDYVMLNANDMMKHITISDEAIQQYYYENKSEFTKPKKWFVTTVLLPSEQSNTKGITQATALLKEKTVDTQQLQHFGYQVTHKWIVDVAGEGDLTTALRPLSLGDITDPIAVDGGELLVKIEKIQPAELIPFNDVKNKIYHLLIKSKAEKTFADKSDELDSLSYETPDSLDDVAKALNLPIQTTTFFSRNQGEGLASHPQVRSIAFSDDVLQTRYNSSVIIINDNEQAVLHLKNYKPESMMPLSVVQSTIEQQLRNEKAIQQVDKISREISSLLNAGKSTDKLIDQYHLQWSQHKNITRDTKELDSDIVAVAFQLPKSDRTQTIKGVRLANGDYIVMKVDKAQNGDINEVPKATKQAIKQQLAQSFGNIDYELYVMGYLTSAKVKKY